MKIYKEKTTVNQRVESLPENLLILQELEEYFRQSALTQKVPLPRWATW